MLKTVILCSLLTICVASVAFAAVDHNKPFYGGEPKSPAEQAADKKFVDGAIKRAGSKDKAEAETLEKGWLMLRRGAPEMAMRFFNMAWLIDPDNAGPLWGFGATLTREGKHAEALDLFARAQAKKPQEPGLLADYGYAWISKGMAEDKNPAERDASFAKGMDLLAQAEKLDPKNPHIYANRAIVSYAQGRFGEAWQNVAKAESLDKSSVDPKFLQDLTTKMPRPR